MRAKRAGIWIVLGVALVCATARASDPPASAPADGPRWESAETSYDFGHAWAGAVLRYPFKFKNVGSQPLVVLEAKPRCACSVAEDYTREVAPGETGVIPFKLNTSGKGGPVSETLTIKLNDPVRPEMVLELKGEIKVVCELRVLADDSAKDGAALEPLRKMGGNFGRVTQEQRLRRVIQMTNRSGAPLELAIARTTGEHYKAELKATKPKEEYELTVTGEPPWPTGYSSGQVVLKTNIEEQPYYQVNLFAYRPARVEVVPQRIVLDPRYPTVLKRTIRITNNGQTPIDIKSVASSRQDFQVQLAPVSLGEPKTRVIHVELPKGYRPPAYGDIVRIETTDQEKPQIDIYVMPSLEQTPAPRPADQPLKFYPGKMP